MGVKFIPLMVMFFLIPVVSAQYFGDFRPSTLLENEWFLFGAIFLFVFSISYLALNRQFGGKSKPNAAFPWLKEPASNEAKGAVIVISLVIAVLTASVFVRSQLLAEFFGQSIVGWFVLITLAILFILSIPFFKALKDSVGVGPAIVLVVLLIWVTLRYFVDPNDLFGNTFGYSEGLGEAYEFISSFWFLVIGGIIGILFAVIKSSGRSR